MNIEQVRKAKELKKEFYKNIANVQMHQKYSFPEVKGIFIGGCIERGVGSAFHAKAHAHNYKESDLFGFICIRSIERIGKYELIENSDGTYDVLIVEPSQLLLHEIAHILIPNHGHDKKWLNKYIELGASTREINKAKNRWKACN